MRPGAAGISQAQIFAAREQVLGLHLAPALGNTSSSSSLATRRPAYGADFAARWIAWGRQSARHDYPRPLRARAWLEGRDYVLPEDVQEVARDVLRHRVPAELQRPRAEGITPGQVLDALLQRVPSAVMAEPRTAPHRSPMSRSTPPPASRHAVDAAWGVRGPADAAGAALRCPRSGLPGARRSAGAHAGPHASPFPRARRRLSGVARLPARRRHPQHRLARHRAQRPTHQVVPGGTRTQRAAAGRPVPACASARAAASSRFRRLGRPPCWPGPPRAAATAWAPWGSAAASCRVRPGGGPRAPCAACAPWPSGTCRRKATGAGADLSTALQRTFDSSPAASACCSATASARRGYRGRSARRPVRVRPRWCCCRIRCWPRPAWPLRPLCCSTASAAGSNLAATRMDAPPGQAFRDRRAVLETQCHQAGHSAAASGHRRCTRAGRCASCCARLCAAPRSADAEASGPVLRDIHLPAERAGGCRRRAGGCSGCCCWPSSDGYGATRCAVVPRAAAGPPCWLRCSCCVRVAARRQDGAVGRRAFAIPAPAFAPGATSQRCPERRGLAGVPRAVTATPMPCVGWWQGLSPGASLDADAACDAVPPSRRVGAGDGGAMFEWAWPWLFLALPLPWLAARVLPPRRRRRRRPASAACAPVRDRCARRRRVAPRPLVARLALAGLGLLVTAAARPQWLSELGAVPRTGRDCCWQWTCPAA